MSKQTVIKKDITEKQLITTREFAAPIDLVWQAWTDPEIIDQWWAPKPWKAVTTKMDFRNGGTWLYHMEGPDGTKHYCRADYKNIIPGKSYSGLDAFCDDKGNINHDFPKTEWNVSFSETATGTLATIVMTFPDIASLEKTIEMGFEQGFTMAHANLDQYLEAQQKIG